MTSDGECDYDMLKHMTSLAPFLIQVPGTNMVRFICGIAPYRGDPFSDQPSSNETMNVGSSQAMLHGYWSD